MMRRFFVRSTFMMLSCFAVVACGMRMVFCRLPMVLGCFLGHGSVFLRFVAPAHTLLFWGTTKAHICEIVLLVAKPS
jgi:hypothetical protein